MLLTTHLGAAAGKGDSPCIFSLLSTRREFSVVMLELVDSPASNLLYVFRQEKFFELLMLRQYPRLKESSL